MAGVCENEIYFTGAAIVTYPADGTFQDFPNDVGQ